jgi:hypothetical protein
MGTTTGKRKTELVEVQRRGFAAGLATYLLGLGIYLTEVIQTWQVGGDEDKT